MRWMILTLCLALLPSCAKKSAKPFEESYKEDPQLNSIVEGVRQRSEAVSQALDSLKEKRIELDHQFENFQFDEDAATPDIEAFQKKSTQLLSAVVNLEPDADLNNLASVLELGVFTNNSKASDVEAFFKRLNDRLSESIAFPPTTDPLLVQYLALKRRQFENQSARSFSSASADLYFSNRMRSQLYSLARAQGIGVSEDVFDWDLKLTAEQNALLASAANKLFFSLSLLEDALPIESKSFNALARLAGLVNPVQLASFAAQRTYNRALAERLSPRCPKELHARHLQRALDHARAALNMLQPNDASVREAFAAVDLLNRYLDESPARVAKLQAEVFYAINDQRVLAVLRDLSKRLQLEPYTKLLQDVSLVPAHPYTALYVSRSQLERGNFAFGERLLRKHFASSDPRTSINTQFNLTGETAFDRYNQGLYQSEYARHLIEHQSAQSGVADRLPDVRRTYLDLAREGLEEALQARYEEHLSSDTLQARDLSRPYVFSLEDLNNEAPAQTGKKRVVLGNKILKPGVYESEGPLELVADRLSFHPLAMIFTDGAKVEMDVKELENPWLDTSPKPTPWLKEPNDWGSRQPPLVKRVLCRFFMEAKVTTHYPSRPGGKYTMGEVLDSPSPYDTYDINPYLQERYKMDFHPGFTIYQGVVYSVSEKWCDKLVTEVKKPVLPSPQNRGDGRNAGDLILSARTEVKGLPLLVAHGSEGWPGFQGASSPLCGEKGYVPIRHYVDPLPDIGAIIRDTNYEIKDQILDIEAGPAGRGGRGGAGALVNARLASHQRAVLVYAGEPGLPGEAAACGPPNVPRLPGETGERAAPGKWEVQ